MEKQQKELLEWLDKFSLAYQLDERFKVIGVEHQNSAQSAKQALRRLVKQFYGEWQEQLTIIFDFIEYCPPNGDFYAPMYTTLLSIGKDIRDFDPMAAEDKEKIKVEVR